MDSSSENSDKKNDGPGTKKEIPSNLQKICLVCGDKALGYNFNAISCESCKAFFRRNALASKEFKCPFTNNCEITVVTRRFCQKCRLEKCLAIGMVKEFIMSEEDKAEKRRKIEENRAKKRHHNSPEDAVSSSKITKRDDEITNTYIPPPQEQIVQYDVLNSTTCSPSSTVQSPLSNDLESSLHSPPMYYAPPSVQSSDMYPMKVNPIEEKTIINRSLYEHRLQQESYNMYDTMDNSNSLYAELPKQNSIRSILTNGDTMTYTEPKRQHVCEEIPSTSTNPDVNKARDILQDVERIEPNSMESILCEAIKLEFEAYTSVNPCGSSRELNEVERAKLNELLVANKALHAPIEDDISQLIGDTASTAGLKEGDGKHDPRLITIVNLTAVAIRRVIKLAKKINAFKNMCEEDQVALLKGGCIEVMILISTMTYYYDGQRNQWKIPQVQDQFGCIRTDVLKLATGNIYRSYESFIRSFDPQWRADEHVTLIMSAIVLFTPDRPKIVHRDVVKLEQLRALIVTGNIYRSYESFIRSFDPQWRADEHVTLIMSAIVLFTPDRPKIVHRDVVKLEQNSYYYLLRRYLESVYPGCEAKSTFLKLIQKILELRKLAEEVTGVYLDVNPIEPLLMEIFDLKHHAA